MTLEEKAKAYAEQPTTAKTWGMHESALKDAYLAGAAEALRSQWRNGKEPPKHNHLVFVITDCNEAELRHATAYYQEGAWNFPDDWYYDCKVLKWMEPPKDESE